MGLFLSWVHPKEPIVIIRTSHTSVIDLFCITFFITSFENKPISIVPLKTAGSIKTLQDFVSTSNWKDFKEIMW